MAGMNELVSTGWLADHVRDADLVVLDASAHLPAAGRDAAAEHAAAHIPGARFLDLASLTDRTSSVPAALPTAGQFAERLAARLAAESVALAPEGGDGASGATESTDQAAILAKPGTS